MSPDVPFISLRTFVDITLTLASAICAAWIVLTGVVCLGAAGLGGGGGGFGGGGPAAAAAGFGGGGGGGGAAAAGAGASGAGAAAAGASFLTAPVILILKSCCPVLTVAPSSTKRSSMIPSPGAGTGMDV